MDEFYSSMATQFNQMYADTLAGMALVIPSCIAIVAAVFVVHLVSKQVKTVVGARESAAQSGSTYPTFEELYGYDDYFGGSDLEGDEGWWYAYASSDEEYWAQYDEWDMNTGLIERDEWMD